MKIFSHRGIGFGISENSIEAYSKAIENGFSIEADIQATKDGELILFHDDNFERLFNDNRSVHDFSFSEIRKYVNTLDELLDIFKFNSNHDQLIALHIKDENQKDVVESTYEKIQKKGLLKKCFIFDITRESCNISKKIDENLQVGLSIGEKRYSKTIYLSEDVDKEFYDINWWDEWKENSLYNKKNLNKIFGKKIYAVSPELHKEEGHVYSGNLNSVKKYWNKLIDLGVDGICTDYPIELRDYLESKLI